MSQALKDDLLAQTAACLEAELDALRASAAAAHAAATHAENKPENKYDTRGLEASYLAGAQEGRAKELQAALAAVKAAVPRLFRPDDVVAVTALVEVSLDGVSSRYFILQVAGGYTLQTAAGSVLTVTPQAPLGRALLGKHVGDEVAVRVAQGVKEYELVALI